MKKTKLILASMDAKYVHTNLAIRYLQKYCESIENLDIEIKEYTINQSRNYIISDLMSGEPDIIGFSSYIWNIEYIMQLSKIIKIAYGESIKILLGGPEVSFESNMIMKNNSFIDYIITGEGEETLRKLMESIVRDEKKDFSGVSGLVYRESGDIIDNSMKKIVSNLDELPTPFNIGDNYKNKLVYYETSRGCPFNCSFCMSSVDKTVRYFSMDRVKRDLDILLKSEARTIKFVDRTFNANYKRAMEIIEYIIEHNEDNIKVHFEMNADIMNEDFLSFMKTLPRNMFQLEIGVQTTNDATLKAINRKEDLKWLSYVVKKLMSYKNIHVHVDLIAGLPYEDFSTFSNSFDDIHNLYADKLQLGFLKVLKGTQIYEKYAKTGLISYDDTPPYEVVKTDWISYDEILILKNIDDLVDKYYNEGYFYRIIRYLIEEIYGNKAFDFYQELNTYWIDKGLFLMKPNRKELYTAIVDFCKIKGCYNDVIEEKILLDYIENNKKDRIFSSFSEDIETKYISLKKKYINENVDKLSEYFEDKAKISNISSNVRLVEIVRKPILFIYAKDKHNLNKQNYTSEKNCIIIDISDYVKENMEE